MVALTENIQPYALSWSCPRCSSPLADERSFVAEYWSGDATVFFVWCVACGWRGEIIEESAVSVLEQEHA